MGAFWISGSPRWTGALIPGKEDPLTVRYIDMIMPLTKRAQVNTFPEHFHR
jgi:hypothetical protein